MDDAQKAAKKKMLTQWMRHQQLAKNDPMQGPRKKRAPGSMHRYEDGSVGSTDRGVYGPGDIGGKRGRRTPKITNRYTKRYI